MTQEEIIEKKVENFNTYNEVLFMGVIVAFIFLIYMVVLIITEEDNY